MVDIFYTIPLVSRNLVSRQISNTKSSNQLAFFVNKVKYFWNKLPNQIKNSNSFKYINIELDSLRKNWRNIISEAIFGRHGSITLENFICIQKLY